MAKEYKPSNFEAMAKAAKAAADAARAAGADEATIKRSAFAAAEALAVHESDPRIEGFPTAHPPEEPVWAARPAATVVPPPPPIHDPIFERMDPR